MTVNTMLTSSAFAGRRTRACRPATLVVSGRRVARASRTAVKVEARRVTVLGAGGGIGQPLSLLLKMNKLVTDLALYDIMGTAGVAADLSHCNTPVNVTAHTGADELESALTGADVVLIPAGVPRKPGMTRDDLFNTNAGIVADLAKACSKYCPDAMVCVITNPVNSTVPICAEVFKAAGTYNPKKLLGVTTLDCVRANTFVAETKDLDLKYVDVPVIGGHSGITILPLLSKVTPPVQFTEDEVAALTHRIQNAGTEVVEAKAGKGSATLSMAYAAARMTESCLLGLSGEDNIFECTFVETDVVPGLQYFATKCRLGPSGVEEALPIPELSKFEEAAFETLKAELLKNVQTGVDFVNAHK